MTLSRTERIRPDLVSGICRDWPHMGVRSGRDPYRTRGPYAAGPGARAWKYRIRPDLASKVIIHFPFIPDIPRYAWQEPVA